MLRRPSVVLLMIGNSATSAAQTTMAAIGFFTQMMISGATATIGVTWSSTAKGNSAVSINRLCTNRNEMPTPSSVARAKASSVTRSVDSRASPSTYQSVASVRTISQGDGTK